jgi:5-methylcytosine-specific restriction endonuclease McrA
MSFVSRNLGFCMASPARTWRVQKLCREHVRLHPQCLWCGGTRGVEAHHLHPVSKYPHLSEDPENLRSLCRSKECHRVLGHMGDYKDENLLLDEALQFGRPRYAF